MPGYREDLAYVHDAGFRDYALNAAPGLLRMLRKNGVTEGLVVDLGCGSGRWAAELNRAGYRVLGVDQSAAMTVSLYPQTGLASAKVKGLSYDSRPALNFAPVWLTP